MSAIIFILNPSDAADAGLVTGNYQVRVLGRTAFIISKIAPREMTMMDVTTRISALTDSFRVRLCGFLETNHKK